MAKFELTRQNIREHALSVLRLDKNNSTNKTIANRAIDMVIADIYARDEFEFTWDREIVQTVADKTAGTVAISASATTVTGTSTAFASTDVGKFIQFSSTNDWYKITAVASATSLTIEKPYVATSNLSGGTYTIRQFFYSLSSLADRYIVVKQAISPTKLRTVYPRELDRRLPFHTQTGNPHSVIIRPLDSSKNRTVEFFPHASSVMNIEFLTKRRPETVDADSDVPKVPGKFHEVVVDGVIARLTRLKDQVSSQTVRQNYQIYEQGIQKMLEDERNRPDWHSVINNIEEERPHLAEQPLGSDSPIPST